MKFKFLGGSEVEFAGKVVGPGDVVDVPSDVAGFIDSRTVIDDDGNEVVQTFGEGLAAQPDMWEPQTKPETESKES